MKHLNFKKGLLFTLAFLVNSSVYAQQDTITQTKIKVEYGVGVTVNETKEGTAEKAKNGRFVGGITFTRLDVGLVQLVDNGSMTLSGTNEFLDYKPWKTSILSFDVLQLGYRFTNNFKVYMAGGFDWTHVRLDRDITIKKDAPNLDYIDETITFSKNRFSSTYVHLPLNFEFRTKENDNGKRFRFVIGPEVAFLLNGKTKQISQERGKVKVSDNYHFTPFRYGATARVGYGGLGFFVKYNATDMFDTADQKGLKNMAFGLTFGLN